MKKIRLMAAAAVLASVLVGCPLLDDRTPGGRPLCEVLREFECQAVKGMKDWEIPGMAIIIVKDDEVIYAKGFGVRQIGTNDPVDMDTIFPIGSASKAFTSALVAMLVDEQHCAWTDKVTAHLPEFQLYDPFATAEFEVCDLMAQRSGLPWYALDTMAFFGYSRDQLRSALRYIPLQTSFRSTFAYQNVMFLNAAALIEKYTGRSYEEALTERLFGPLGLTSACCTLEDYLGSPNHAVSHRRPNDWYWGEVEAIPDTWRYHDWVYTLGPAGCIAASANDLARWVRFQLGKGQIDGQRFVSEENMDYLHTPKIYLPDVGSDSEMGFYCEAWVYNTYKPHDIIWHSGGTLGATCMVSMVPDDNLGIVILTNLRHIELHQALHKTFYDLYYGNPFVDYSAQRLAKQQAAAADQKPMEFVPPTNFEPLDHYAGVYENNVFGQVNVNVTGDKLTLVVGPAQIPMPLTPVVRDESGDQFLLNLPDFTEDDGAVTFVLDNGYAQTMTVEYFNECGAGVFQRVP